MSSIEHTASGSKARTSGAVSVGVQQPAYGKRSNASSGESAECDDTGGEILPGHSTSSPKAGFCLFLVPPRMTNSGRHSPDYHQ